MKNNAIRSEKFKKFLENNDYLELEEIVLNGTIK